MICKRCQKNQYKEMLKEKDKAIKRYTDKIRKESNVRRKNNKKNEKM